MMKDFRLNTMLSEAMILTNTLTTHSAISRKAMERFIVTLSPAFPFLSEEIWAMLGHHESIFKSRWPKYFGATETTQKIKILINQRFVDEIEQDAEIDEAKLIQLVKTTPKFAQKLGDRNIIRTIYKNGELLNIITG